MTSTMGPGPEFDRIRAIAAALGEHAGDLGDDCASIPVSGGMIVVSTDASVEHVHFKRNWLTLEEIGYRSAAAALSDLAAQAAEPRGVLVAVTQPAESSSADVAELMRGAGRAAADSNATVLGGDLSRGSQWAVTATVLGFTARPILRSGATPGDGLWVTGVLGGARAALDAFREGRAPDPDARIRFAAPAPRIRQARWLAEHGAHAMLDLSDGIPGDASHLAAASGVEAEIILEQLPVHHAAVAAALAARAEPVIYAAKGGEDYELLVALPETFGGTDALEFEHVFGLTVTRVGSCRRGSGVRLMFRGSRLTLQGFDHFR